MFYTSLNDRSEVEFLILLNYRRFVFLYTLSIMAGSALRRLMAEYKRNKPLVEFLAIQFLIFLFVLELTLNPPEGIVAGPISEDNFFEWEALIA